MFKVAPAVTSPRTATSVWPLARRLLAVLLLACAPLLGMAPAAQAHNVLIGSDPQDGARLAAAPSRVTLTFDQPVRADFAKIAVTGPDGARYEDGEVTVRGDDVGVSLRGHGPAGEYVIGYQIVSNDGHPVIGKLTFTVTAPGAPATSPAAEAAPGSLPTDDVKPGVVPATGVEVRTQSSGGGWVWGLLVGTAGLLALATFVLIRHDRRMRAVA